MFFSSVQKKKEEKQTWSTDSIFMFLYTELCIQHKSVSVCFYQVRHDFKGKFVENNDARCIIGTRVLLEVPEFRKESGEKPNW